MDLINRAAGVFSSKRSSSLALQVTYDDGNNAPYSLVATYAENNRISEDAGGSQITAVETQQDFLVRRADMTAEPQAGDLITADIGGLRSFRVSGYAGLPSVQNSDPYRIDIRIHATEVL